MSLTDWARGLGIYPQAGYWWFGEGMLPVPAVRVDQRTVLVSPAVAAPEPFSHFGLDARVSGCRCRTGRCPCGRRGGWVMGSGAKVGELRRAAQQLGVAGATLREHGWMTGAAGRIEAVSNSPAGWLIEARERRRQEKARRRRLREGTNTATRLGVQVRAVKARDIKPGEAGDLLAAPPAWLVAGQARRQAQTGREAKDRLRRDLTDALVTSVHDAWLQELKGAISEAEAAAIGARWAPEAGQAKREARHLAGEMSPGQVRAWAGREQAAAHEAGVSRATELARRAFGGGRG